MSKESLAQKLSALGEEPKGKSVADALDGKVGNLQAMLGAIKSVPRCNAPAVLQTLFGIDEEEARRIVDLLSPRQFEGVKNATNGYVREQIARRNQEKGIENRARGENPSNAMAKVIKKAASLCDRLDDLDREKALEVLRECMDATTPYFNKETGKTEERVDARMRLAAVTLQLAYDEGLPVQRVLTGRVEMESAEETLARLRASPEALKAIAGLKNAGINLEIDGETIDVEAEVLPPEGGANST